MKNKDLSDEIRELQERLKNLELSEGKRILAEEQLLISETRYRRLIETIKDGILIIDADTGEITDVNTVLIDMLGYLREDYLGKKLWEIGPFKFVPASKTAFEELQFKESVRYEELPVETKDGRNIDVEFVCNVYPVDHKKVVQCNIRDITERKVAEESARSMARFSDENPNPVLRISEHGRVIYANQASAPLLKEYKCEVGQPLPEPLRGQVLDSLRRGIKKEMELECREAIFSLDVEPIVDSGYVDLYGTDVTTCKRLESERERLNAEAENSLELMLGRSEKMREIIEQIRRISKTDFTVLIQGETGVGKSFIANIIHNLSPRAHNPFIRIDMGTIPETLFESELFGYEKGAFTGADKKRKGLFELAANGGTIFIDELENMTPYAQSKFLTVIEEKKIHPLGSSETKDIDVRFISATNRDVKQALAEKNIRKDLFYRLSEFMITIPPLRERVDDIPFLAQKFLIEAEAKLKVQVKNFSEEIFDVLKRYPWPGNVRELRNIIIRRAVLMSQDHSTKLRDMEFLLDDTVGSVESLELLPLKELTAIAVKDVERKAIKKALELTKGNKSKAALILHVDYKTLLTKIKEYNFS